jgi:hypothetical protein
MACDVCWVREGNKREGKRESRCCTYLYSWFNYLMALPDLTIDSSLKFKLILAGTEHSNPISVSAKILATFGQFTLSPVLRIALDGVTSIPSEVVLKLYDRRCMTNARDEFDEGHPFTLQKEREYKQYIRACSQGDVQPCDFDDQVFVDETEMSDGQFEAYLEHSCRKMFTDEFAAYQQLRTLQGTRVPRLYGTVEYQSPPLIDDDGSEVELDLTHGILLEYISSVSLRSFVDIWRTSNEPSPSILSSVCDDAVVLINQTSDYDILNTDVRLDNILVRLLTSPGSIPKIEDLPPNPCVLIDLAQCRLRREDEDEDAWVAAKWSQDEEGAVGFVVAGLLKRLGHEGVWGYKRSLRYYRPLENEQ